MKFLPFIFLLVSYCALNGYAQSDINRFQVGNSGCSASFYGQPDPAELSYSPDSSKVYTMESADLEGVTSSIILVQLSNVYNDDEIEGLITSYLDFLKGQFKVVNAAGYNNGYKLHTHLSAKGVVDTWVSETDDIHVMACSDGRIVAVLMVFADKGKDVIAKRDTFYKSFRFPGD
jgi:hypothetical protein